MLTKQVHAAVAADNGNRIAAYDLIRVFAAFSVVVVHVASPVSSDYNDQSLFNQQIIQLYQAVFRSGIPLFLMLSGALLLPYATSLQFVKRRVLRVLIPLSFWTLIFTLAKNQLSTLSLSGYFNNLLDGAAPHYWYVYFILVLYFTMPLIYVVLSKIKVNVKYLFVLTLIATFASYFVKDSLEPYSSALEYSIYILYLILGYKLATEPDNMRFLSIQVGILLFLMGTLVTLIGSTLLSTQSGIQNDLFYESTGTHIFIKAIGAWIILHKISEKVSVYWQDFLRSISSYTFGIYLMHTLVLEHLLISRLGISYTFFTPFVGVILTAFLTFVFSILIAALLKKLPYGSFTL